MSISVLFLSIIVYIISLFISRHFMIIQYKRDFKILIPKNFEMFLCLTPYINTVASVFFILYESIRFIKNKFPKKNLASRFFNYNKNFDDRK